MKSSRATSRAHSRSPTAFFEKPLRPGYFRLYTRARAEHEIYSVDCNTLVAFSPRAKIVTA